MQTKLTIRVDDRLIGRTKAHARHSTVTAESPMMPLRIPASQEADR